MDNAVQSITHLVTVILSRFAFRLVRETLIEMNCVLSIASLSLVTNGIDLLLIYLLKQIYKSTPSHSISFFAKVSISTMQLAKFNLDYSDFASPSESSRCKSLILSVLVVLIISTAYRKQRFSYIQFAAIVLLLIGSFCILLRIISSDRGNVFFITINALLSAVIADYSEYTLITTGVSVLDFQYSLAPMKFFGSMIPTGVFVTSEPFPSVGLTLSPLPILLLVGGSALELAYSFSIAYLTMQVSSISSVVAELMCETVTILVSELILPPGYKSANQTTLVHIGLAVSIVGYSLYFTHLPSIPKMPRDTEPLHVDGELASDTLSSSELQM